MERIWPGLGLGRRQTPQSFRMPEQGKQTEVVKVCGSLEREAGALKRSYLSRTFSRMFSTPAHHLSGLG